MGGWVGRWELEPPSPPVANSLCTVSRMLRFLDKMVLFFDEHMK